MKPFTPRIMIFSAISVLSRSVTARAAKQIILAFFRPWSGSRTCCGALLRAGRGSVADPGLARLLAEGRHLRGLEGTPVRELRGQPRMQAGVGLALLLVGRSIGVIEQ